MVFLVYVCNNFLFKLHFYTFIPMYLKSFLNYLNFEKRASKHTAVSYETDILQFKKYLSNTNKTLIKAEYKDVRLWVASLMTKGNKAKTINRKISSLKSFYNFLIKTENVKVNPATNISNLKEPQRTPNFISEKEIDQIFDNMPNPQNYFEYRNQVIFEMFYNTGIRRDELINIEDKHIDFSQENILIFGKGKKERKIPLNNSFIKQLKNYIRERNEFKGSQVNDFLFLSKRKTKLYPKNVYNIINEFLNKSISSEKKSPHILRHTFATHLLNKGADLNAIKELLGHSSLAATQIYTHNSIEKLKEIHKQAHPKS